MKDAVPLHVSQDLPRSLCEEPKVKATRWAEWLLSDDALCQNSVRTWISFLASYYAVFRTIAHLFPRHNDGRQDKKDACCVATTPEEMLAIANQLFILKSHSVDGTVMECGCFKGFSSSCLSHVCDRLDFPFVVADSFAGLPNNANEVGPDAFYQGGDFCGTRDEVEDNIRTFGLVKRVEFQQGWFCETLANWDRPLALLWIDVDLASSVDTVLQSCLPCLVPQGAIFSHEFLPGYIRDDRIVRTKGPAGAIARWVEQDDPHYRAEFSTDNLAMIARRSTSGFGSCQLLQCLLPRLSRIGVPESEVKQGIKRLIPPIMMDLVQHVRRPSDDAG